MIKESDNNWLMKLNSRYRYFISNSDIQSIVSFQAVSHGFKCYYDA